MLSMAAKELLHHAPCHDMAHHEMALEVKTDI